MKNPRIQFPKFLAVLPSLDFFQPQTEDSQFPSQEVAGGVGLASPFDSVDFNLISNSPTNPGAVFGYSELHLDSTTDGGTVPIKSQDDPERVMFVGGIPAVGANWSMSLVLTKGSFSDTVSMGRVSGSYTNLRQNLPDGSVVVAEDPGIFYTIKLANGTFTTYVNVNISTEVARLQHNKAETFDLFGVSLLGRAN